jgi:hypothetical protein
MRDLVQKQKLKSKQQREANPDEDFKEEKRLGHSI